MSVVDLSTQSLMKHDVFGGRTLAWRHGGGVHCARSVRADFVCVVTGSSWTLRQLGRSIRGTVVEIALIYMNMASERRLPCMCHLPRAKERAQVELKGKDEGKLARAAGRSVYYIRLPPASPRCAHSSSLVLACFVHHRSMRTMLNGQLATVAALWTRKDQHRASSQRNVQGGITEASEASGEPQRRYGGVGSDFWLPALGPANFPDS